MRLKSEPAEAEYIRLVSSAGLSMLRLKKQKGLLLMEKAQAGLADAIRTS